MSIFFWKIAKIAKQLGASPPYPRRIGRPGALPADPRLLSTWVAQVCSAPPSKWNSTRPKIFQLLFYPFSAKSWVRACCNCLCSVVVPSQGQAVNFKRQKSKIKHTEKVVIHNAMAYNLFYLNPKTFSDNRYKAFLWAIISLDSVTLVIPYIYNEMISLQKTRLSKITANFVFYYFPNFLHWLRKKIVTRSLLKYWWLFSTKQGCRNPGGWGDISPPIIWLYPPNNLSMVYTVA